MPDFGFLLQIYRATLLGIRTRKNTSIKPRNGNAIVHPDDVKKIGRFVDEHVAHIKTTMKSNTRIQKE